MKVSEDLHLDEVREEIPCVVKEAFWDQLAASVVVGNDNLLPLDIYMLSKQFAHMHDVGVRTVPGDQIRGKVGMSSDFDALLMPRQEYVRLRWTNEDRVRFHDASLPMINLLKIEDNYLVLDGHHRLSLASIYNRQTIKAYVIEVEKDEECQHNTDGTV